MPTMISNEERAASAEHEQKRKSLMDVASALRALGDKESPDKTTGGGESAPAAAASATGRDNDDEDEENTAPRFIPEHKRPDAALTFPEKLMKLMRFVDKNKDDAEYCVAWMEDGKSFMIRSPDEFTRTVLPKFFKQTKFSSFTRKLYRWGFRQVNRGIGPDDPIIFGNDHFQRDNAALMAKMRSTTARKQPQQQQFEITEAIERRQRAAAMAMRGGMGSGGQYPFGGAANGAGGSGVGMMGGGYSASSFNDGYPSAGGGYNNMSNFHKMAGSMGGGSGRPYYGKRAYDEMNIQSVMNRSVMDGEQPRDPKRMFFEHMRSGNAGANNMGPSMGNMNGMNGGFNGMNGNMGMTMGNMNGMGPMDNGADAFEGVAPGEYGYNDDDGNNSNGFDPRYQAVAARNSHDFGFDRPSPTSIRRFAGNEENFRGPDFPFQMGPSRSTGVGPGFDGGSAVTGIPDERRFFSDDERAHAMYPHQMSQHLRSQMQQPFGNRGSPISKHFDNSNHNTTGSNNSNNNNNFQQGPLSGQENVLAAAFPSEKPEGTSTAEIVNAAINALRYAA